MTLNLYINVNVDQMQVFVVINNVGTMINIDVKGPYIKNVGGGARGFLWGYEVFQAYIDGPGNIFQNF